MAYHPFILVSRSRLHAFPPRRWAWQMVQKHAHRRDPGILPSLRINGAMARHRAALHPVWSLHGNTALCVPHFLQLEKASSAVARRPILECARRFHHFQRGLLRSANFLWAHRRCADCTTTAARETFDAEGCSLALRIYRKMLVLKTLGHRLRLLRLDLFGRGVQ